MGGEKDDGSIKDFDYVWDGTKKTNGLNYHKRSSTLSDGFQHYMNDYYFDAKTTSTVQGCDGKKLKCKKGQKDCFKHGVHYKMKRVKRKVAKAIHKISRRRLEPLRKGKNQAHKQN